MNTDIETPTFAALQLPDYLLKAIETVGYSAPTWVQRHSIPLIREGRDMLVEARTGTGKTAAFVLPIIERINVLTTSKRRGGHTLVLTPTRELALQVSDFFERYSASSPTPISTVTVIGGVNSYHQLVKVYTGAQVIIGTPGRLADLLREKQLKLDYLQMLVLDEADKLLSQGFQNEIDEIVAAIPSENRQTLLFSATLPDKVQQLASHVLRNPTQIKAPDSDIPLESIVQHVYEIARDNRRMALQHLIESWLQPHVLVFVSSKRAAANLSRKLLQNNINAKGFHGDLSQQERTSVLAAFNQRETEVLIATDIAARGIDFRKLSHVVNYDLPRSPTDYVHRIGRTGRAGEQGEAITFVHQENISHFLLIEKRTGLTVERRSIPGFELREPISTIRNKGPAPVKGKRKSKKDKLREAGKQNPTANPANKPTS